MGSESPGWPSKIWTGIRLGVKWTFRISLVIILGALIYFSPNIYHVYKWNPVFTPLSSYFYGNAESLSEAQLEDLEFLRKLPTIDRSFTAASLARFDSQISDMEQRAGSMSDAEFALGVARAVAQADNGHTNISQRSLIMHNNRLPRPFLLV